MNNVYAFGYKAPDTFGRLQSGQWLYDGTNGQDHFVSHGGKIPEYWNKRNEFLANNSRIIQSASELDAGLFNRYTSSDMDVAQVIASKTQWERIEAINNGGSGTIVTYDIETLGDIGMTKSHKVIAGDIARYQRYDGYAGITEIGFNIQSFDNGTPLQSRAVSIAVGINADQQTQLAKLISRFEHEGWSSLDRTEQSTLNRLTAYAGNYNDIFGEESLDFLGGRTYTVVKGIHEPTRTAKDMRSGLQNLSRVNRYGTRGRVADVLPVATQYLTDMSDAGNILIAANARFDTQGLANQASISGLSINFNPDVITNNTADVIYAQRAMGQVERISALDHQNRIHEGKTYTGEQPNTVSNTMRSLRMEGEELHMGGDDSRIQSEIATTRNFIPINDNEYKSFAQAATESAERAGITSTDYLQQYFLLERGTLNKNALDQADVDGNVTHSHSIAGSYYEIDLEHSGYVRYDGLVEEGATREATESFVLALRNADVSESTTIYIEADSLESALDRLDSTSTMIDKSKITKAQIAEQTKYKYADIARREYDKFFDPTEVTVTGSRIDEYGVEGLRKYLQISDEVHDLTRKSDIRNIDSLDKVYKRTGTSISDILASHGLKSTYQQRTFAGMYARLRDEREVLGDAIDYIDEVADGANNFTKTSILRDAVYAFRTDYTPSEVSTTNILLQDALGIDIQTGDGTFARVNASTSQHATSDLARIFKDSTGDNIRKAMEDLHARKVITDRQFEQISRNIADSGLTGGYYNAFVNIGYALNDVVSPISQSSNPIRFMQKVYAGTSGLSDEAQASLAAKTVRSFAQEATVFNRSMYNFGGENIPLSALGKSNLHDYIEMAVQDASIMRFDTSQEKVISELAYKLNYSEAETDMLRGMFGQKDKAGRYKKYAINGRSDISAFVVSPFDEGANAYVLLTNRQHANTLAEAINSGLLNEQTLSSRSELVKATKDFAAVYELPYINKTDLGAFQHSELAGIFGSDNAQVVSINQGRSYERFMIPTLDVYEYDGAIRAEIKSGTSEYLSSFRMNANLLDAVADGEFEKASKGWARSQSRVLAPLSAPSSYRAFKTADGTVRRVANYNINDYLHGFNFNTDKMMELLRYTASVDGDNAVKAMLDMFNESKGIAVDIDGRIKAGAYSDVINSQQFKEFFTKNLFIGSVADDMNIAGQIASFANNPEGQKALTTSLDKNIFGIIKDVVDSDSTGLFSDSVRDALKTIHNATPYMTPVVSESGVANGIVSFMRHGDIFWNGAINPTLRPTYTQAGNAILFEARDFNASSLSRGSRLGSILRTHAEHDILQAMDLTYSAPSGNAYSSQYRTMTSTFKQMSDADLQFKYKDIRGRLGKIAGERGLSVESLRRALDIFQAENMSLNEGKWIGRARVFNEDAFTSADVKRVGIPELDESFLQKLVGQEIDSNTAIGKINGRHVYWEGPATVLTKENVDELLNPKVIGKRETTVLPINADIQDIKLMFGNAEKATMHTIRIDDAFMQINSSFFREREEAARYFDAIFDELVGFKGSGYQADVIGNMSLMKHTTNLATDSAFRVIVNEYANAGRLDVLARAMNGMTEFSDWNIEEVNGFLLGTNSSNQGIASAYNSLIERVRTNDFGEYSTVTKGLNQTISGILDTMNSNDLLYGELTRTGQNQHMGTSVTLDQRMEQAIRLRNRSYFDVDGINGVTEGITGTNGETWEQIYTRLLRQNIESGEYHRVADMGGELAATREVLQSISDVKNKSFASHIQAVKDKRGILGGILESLVWSDTADHTYAAGKNIVTVKMSDVISRLPKSGASSDDLQKFLFKVNGKPSSFLRELAAKQNVNLSSGSFSMYLDFEGAEVALKRGSRETTYRGMLVPIQNVITGSTDDVFWVNHQKEIISFINRYRENIDSLGLTGVNQGKLNVADAIDRLLSSYAKELAIMDKNSEAYKTIGKMMLPNSTQVLAQDEVAAFVEGMDTGDIRQSLIRERKLREAIRTGDVSVILELDEVLSKRQGTLDEIAKRVADGEVLDFVQLKNAGIANRGKVVVNGKTYYDNAVGISRKTFEAMNFDFGRSGFDLFLASERGELSQYDGGDRFKITSSDKKRIIQQLEDSGISVKDGNILRAVEDYHISIKDLNANITTRGKAMNAFDFLGVRYASEVGIVGREAWRYPVFRSQNIARYYLDESVMGKQVRYYNPAFSSIINVDFDGDTGSISLAGSTLRKIDGSDKEYYALFRSYQIGLQHNNNLIADLIRDGDAFKKDLGADVFLSNANTLKSFDEDAYNRAVLKFAKKQGYNVSSVDELTKGQLAAASYSREVMQAFREWDEKDGNLLYNEKVIKASLTAKIRKEEIGSASTPNFTLRNAVESVIENNNYTPEQRKHFADILDILSTPSSKAGGILTITEQKSIDVKHIVDAYNVADTPKWATGLGTMFNLKTKRSKTAGLRDLVEASNHILFKANPQDFDAIVADIIDDKSTIEALTQRIANATDKAAIEDATFKRYFRAIFELSQVDQAASIYRDALNKGRNYEAVRKAIQTIQSEGIEDSRIHNILSSFMKDYTSAGSADRLMVDDKTILVVAGGLGNRGLDNYGLLFDRFETVPGKTVAVFQRRDLNTFKIMDEIKFEGKSVSDINKRLSTLTSDVPGVNFHAFKEGTPEFRLSVRNRADATRFSNIVESVVFDNQLKNLNKLSIKTLQSVNAVNAVAMARELFTDHKASASIVNRTLEMTRAYEYALNKGVATNAGGVRALIRDLNNDIASHPERYRRQDGFIENYDALFRSHLVERAFGGEESLLNNMMSEYKVLGNFDSDAYRQSLDFLNSGLYDIIDEESLLRASYDTLEGLPGDAVSSVLEHKEADIANSLKALRQSNMSTVSTAQSQIYSLFENNKQMTAFFKWDKAGKDSIVGYGEYIGLRFSQLSEADVSRILESSMQVSEGTIRAMSNTERFAFERTNALLNDYMQGTQTLSADSALRATNRIKRSSDVSTIIREHENIVSRIQTSNPQAAPKVKKRTITGSMTDSLKDINWKQLAPKIGIGVAAMTALGIANNMLHNQRTQSPLTPARKENGNQAPDTGKPPVKRQAPASRQRTVYHDNGSGLQFKVNAKTKNYINDVHNARLIGMSGGGQASVHSQADMSGVTNNWLENKFAELS